MNFSNTSNKAIQKQLHQGRKALFSMLVMTIKKLNMPIDIECNLFEKMVFPILLYLLRNLKFSLCKYVRDFA